MVFHAGEILSAILFITSVSGSDWPSGWYGLPEPKSGCPSSSEWGSGWWFEDRRLNNQSTARVPQYSHLKGIFVQDITKRYFCIKKKDNGLKKLWPDGQYCIYQGFLKPCPPGFVNGSIGWKNKDPYNNNHHSRGKSINLPNGVFASSTRISYCCRVDGSKENSISLPINRPFLLLAYNSCQCQSVKWARTIQEYVRFSVQEKMTLRGFHPFVDDNYALRYCYYQSSNQTLTTSNGKVSRYLNQTSIHQERYSAWLINPYSFLPVQFLILLSFTRFIFHASNITSYLEVFDGRNESAPSLGRFSSTQSPLGQNITSSTNQLFVVLQFGDRSGMYNFEFNYHICSPTVSTTAKIKTPSHTSTSSTTKMTSSSPYTSSSSPKVTSLPPTTVTSSHYNNVTIPTNRTAGTQLHLHGNNMLLLYTLLPTGGLLIVIVIIIAVIIRWRRRKRIAYSRLASPSTDEIVSELTNTSCAVTSNEHQLETGMFKRTRLRLLDSTEHTPSDSDDEMICLDRNPPGFPNTELQDVAT